MNVDLTLRNRLIALVIAAILPIFGLAVVGALLNANDAVRRTHKNLEFSASLVAANQERLVQSARQLLTTIAIAPGLSGGSTPGCRNYFRHLTEQLAFYSNIGLVGADGQVLCDSRETQEARFVEDNPFFIDALAARRFVVGGYRLGLVDNAPAIAFGLPVLADDGITVKAVAFAVVSLSRLSGVVSSDSLPPGGRLLIADKRGSVLISKPENPDLIGKPLQGSSLQGALKSGVAGLGEATDAYANKVIYAFARAGEANDAHFFVAVSSDWDDVMAPSRTRLMLVFLSLTLVSLLGSWMAWAVGKRSIVAPALKILEAAGLIETGRLEVRIAASAGESRSEMTQIAEGFNRMAASLEQRHQSLEQELERSRRAHSTLELTVNSMREGIVTVDTDGRLMLVNDHAKRLLSIGETRAYLSRQWASEQGFFAPDTGERLGQSELPLNRALQGEIGGPVRLLMRNERRPEERLLSCHFQPMYRGDEIVGAMALFSDITDLEQLHAEKEKSFADLKEMQRKLSDAQHVARLGFWEYDIKRNSLWVSDEVNELFEVLPGTFEENAQAYREFMHPDDREAYAALREQAFAQGVPLDFEYRITTGKGKERWIHQFDRLELDSEGQPQYRIGIVQEITERKRSELLILHSAELLNRTGKIARIGGWELMLDQMVLVCSEEIYRIHDVEPEVHTPLDQALSFYSNDAQPVIRRAIEEGIENGTPWNLVLSMVTAKGRKIRVRVQGEAIRDDGKTLRLVGTLQDVTEQQEAQAHLHLLQAAIARLNDVVLITEASPLDLPGPRIVFVNDAFEVQTGYTREETIGKTPRLLQGPLTDRAELDRIGASLRRWEPVRSELVNYKKNGEAFWLELDIVPLADASGRFTHWVAVERDITQRKLAELALQQSEQRYTALFTTAPVPMWVYDSETLRFLTVNQAALDSYGYSKDEFLAMTILEIRSEEDAKALQELRAISPDIKRPRWEHRRKDGSSLMCQVVSKPVQYAGRAGRFVIAIDVTSQAKAEAEVQEHLYTLQRAADAAQAITWHQTLKGTMKEIVEQARGVIGAHQAVAALYHGGTQEQPIRVVSLSEKYAKYRKLVDPNDGSRIYDMVAENNRAIRMTQEEMLAHPRWRGFDDRAEKHAPMRGWLAVPLMGRNGKSIGVLQLSDKYEGDFSQQDEYVAIEMAQLASSAIENAQLIEQVNQLNAGLEHKVAERTAALARQEALFRALAEQAPQVVWTADTKGRLTFMNRAWFDLAGGKLEDWLGNKWVQSIHPDDLPGIKACWQTAVAHGTPFVGIRRLRAKDGSYHTMSYRASPVYDEQGEIAFWVGIDADISEIKAIESALRISNQELEAFSYSVSHDLRSPLNTIDGFSRLLSKQLANTLDDKGKHYLSRVQAGVAQMGQLIEDLLSLAQVSRAQLRVDEIDLSALAELIIAERHLSSPDRQVSIQVEGNLKASGDGRLLHVVLENLIGNAWKFTNRVPQAHIVIGRVADAAGQPIFFVRDNGAGFDMAYADKLFTAFQRLHTASEFPGTGIGLATASRIIARHNGRLWAEAELGKGATFFFTLPRKPGGAEQSLD